MVFWAVAMGLAVLVAVLVVLALLRGGRMPAQPAAAYDLRVYREQLREIEKDLARGVIAGDEAQRTRVEVSRRVLEADRALKTQKISQDAPAALTLGAVGVVVATILGVGYWGYTHQGAPGYPDLPLAKRIEMAKEMRASRPSQTEAEAENDPAPAPERPDPKHVEMLERLRAIVAERPQDQRGFELLARNEAALGHFARAHAAQARVIALKGDEATAMDYATLADMMVLAAGGYVSPEAEGALSNALNRNPNNGTALYYWGLMHAQTGRPDVTFRVWRQLLQNSGPDDPWVRPIRGQIEDLALRAGVNYTLPPEPTLRGPSAADIENAGDMTPEQRQQMIAGMVASLSDRLATQGGTPQEWAQLIRALGTLNDTARANGIWMEAQQVFSASPEAMETLRNAARAAGLLE